VNTPAHVIFSLGVLGWKNASSFAVAIALGALFPDLAMILFYAVEKLQGVAEEVIWNQHYFLPTWQNWFDITNSIPLLAIFAVCCLVLGRKALALFFASAIFHCVLDFLVHHDDSHRHFFPFSRYRFESPVSYWDPAYYGNIVGLLEATVFVVIAVLLWIQDKSAKTYPFQLSPLRLILVLTAMVYSVFLFFVVTVWM
jgi:hypothetical protein